jgi:RNA polymerase sigma factor (sigma-70 family)
VRGEAKLERGGAAPGPRATAEQPSLEVSDAYARGQDLLAGCIAGDPRTRGAFADQYTGLIRFAIVAVLRQRGLTIQKEEVDDLTHGVMLSLFDRDCRKLRMYEGRNHASLATFLRVCTTRYVLDHIRHQRRRPIEFEFEGDPEREGVLDEAADPHPGPEAGAQVAEEIASLRRAVAELTPREQLLVRLHFAEGVDISEVARILGLTENAAYVLKSRVKKKLRLELRESANDG